MLLERLNIFGWSEQYENAMLASICTGDPLLMIGKRGSAKTQTAKSLARSMEYSFVSYDASKALFEEEMGFPSIQKLKEDKMEYVSGDRTLWDKDFCFIDELNRASADMQSKWLEVIRSREIMGKKTGVKWVWAAMNPESYAGANTLDEAMTDRFSWFVFPPDAVDLEDEQRKVIASNIGEDDAPALAHWVPALKKDTHKADGDKIKELCEATANMAHYLIKDFGLAAEFISRYCMLMYEQSKHEIEPTGRRLGMMYRNMISYRAVEMAKSMLYGTKLPPLRNSVRDALRMTIPALSRDEQVKYHDWSDAAFEVLADYFRKGKDIEVANRAYAILTTRNIDTLITNISEGGINDVVCHRAWKRMMDQDAVDINRSTLRALVNLVFRIESQRPGFIPGEMIASLGELLETKENNISFQRLDPAMSAVIGRINKKWDTSQPEIAEVCRSLAYNVSDPEQFEARAMRLGSLFEELVGV